MFAWDEANRDHVERHSVATLDYEAALQDPDATTVEWSSAPEKRWRTVGQSGQRKLIVFWTVRESMVRVVTAWWIGRRTRI